MLQEMIDSALQSQLRKKQQEVIRLKWEKAKWEDVVKKLKEQQKQQGSNQEN